MEFRTKYDDIAYEHAEVSGDSMCQASGYMKVSDMVKNYEVAGLQLTAARMAQFDFAAGKEIPEDYQDITRYQDVDKFMLIDVYRSRMQQLKAAAAAQGSGGADERSSKDVKDAAISEGSENAAAAQPATSEGVANG